MNCHQDNFDECAGSSYNFRISVDENFDVAADMNSCSLLVDSGATSHIINDRAKFVRLDPNFNPRKHFIELADGSRKNNLASAKGDALVEIADSRGRKQKVILNGALCIPSYSQEILSVQAVAENGGKIKFLPKCALLETPDGNTFDIKKTGKLYYLNSAKSTEARTLEEWHRTLGHCNVRDVINLESAVSGMKILGKDKFNCEPCAEGKMIQFRNRTPDKKATRPLELVHSDLAGPITPASHDNSKYVILFIDDFSGIVVVYFLKNKNDAAGATAKFLADMAPHGHVQTLRTDNGTEYTSQDYKSLMVRNQIRHEFSSPYSPHQNGTAERSWRSMFDMARCMLIESGLPKTLWNYAVRTASYIRNRCLNNTTRKTPFELFTSKRPDIRNMHIFGSTCFAYIQNTQKLDARAKKGKFVGYDPLSPAFLVYFSDKNQVKRVRCVTFHDTIPTKKYIDECECDHLSEENLTTAETLGQPTVVTEAAIQPALPGINTKQTGEAEPVDQPILSAQASDDSNVRRNPVRQRNKPIHLADYVNPDEDPDLAICTIDHFYRASSIPRSYREAVSSPEASQWTKAMQTEMSALIENDTFELSHRPRDRDVIGGRWVYSIKEGNNQQNFKARYVAKGYKQVEDLDYKETFAPTARMSSVRALMNIAVQEDFKIHQMDVKSAYLNAPIDTDIYVEQPDGFIQGENDKQLVFKLKKALYGLRQSGHLWNNLLHSFLISNNFVQSMSDNCVYTKHSNNCKIILIIWVDDIIIAASNLESVICVKKALSDQFKMKDLGTISNFLGIQFIISDQTIEMNQSNFVDKLLIKFNMSDCHPKSIPCDPGIDKLGTDLQSQELADPKLYREIVGSLIYLMTCTRPDICYVVTKLSQHLAKPTFAHFNLSKYVLRYLKGTKNRGLRYVRSKNEINHLIAHSDSDWGGGVVIGEVSQDTVFSCLLTVP